MGQFSFPIDCFPFARARSHASRQTITEKHGGQLIMRCLKVGNTVRCLYGRVQVLSVVAYGMHVQTDTGVKRKGSRGCQCVGPFRVSAAQEFYKTLSLRASAHIVTFHRCNAILSRLQSYFFIKPTLRIDDLRKT